MATYYDDGVAISTAVAINRNKNSQQAARWAVENLRSKDNGIALLHVCTHPYSDSHNGEGEGPTTDQLIKQLFLPYRSLCARKGIRAKEVILYDIDIPGALCEFISANSIRTIIFGASNRSAIARAFKNADVPTSVGKSAPDTCSVYSISSKGKPNLMKSANGSLLTTSSSIHRSTHSSGPLSLSSTSSISHSAYSAGFSSPSLSDQSQVSWWTATSDASSMDASSQPRQSLDHNSGQNSREYPQMTPRGGPSVRGTPSSLNSLSSNEYFNTSAWGKHHGTKNQKPDTCFYSSFSSSRPSPENSRYMDGEFGHTKKFPFSKMNALQQSTRYQNLRGRDLDALVSLSSASSDTSNGRSFQSEVSYEFLDQTRNLDASKGYTTSPVNEIEEELKRMKLELKQITEKYNAACQEAVICKEKVRDIAYWESEEARKIEEAKHEREAALAIVEIEKQKCKAAVEMAQKAQQLAELEAEMRKCAEMIFKHESEEKQKIMSGWTPIGPQYQKYTFDEIDAVTNHFSSSNKIGEGGYGPVYKATLDHTRVAIKVLSSDISEGQKQFQQEVEVLSQMRHPNMVILLGACPERSCLIYEYMDNGSLEDRLFCKNGTPPLPWRVRFRIAAEIATALNFLHQRKPQPLVHRDLKPDNILLDRNYVSKISDVGLARLVPPSVTDTVTQYHMTAAAGTFCYIDPEYQQTGMLGTKSDIYSLGIILLQIITAKPPIGLAHTVEQAIEMGKFQEVLDRNVKDWPVDKALSLAKLALQCCELRRRDRPDLHSVILPKLERLRDLGS